MISLSNTGLKDNPLTMHDIVLLFEQKEKGPYMKEKLLIVHPHHCYDNEGMTRQAIAGLYDSFDPASRYVLVSKEADDVLSYLDIDRMPEHMHFSAHGEMSQVFATQLIDGATAIVIAGHTMNYCHHTAFQYVFKACLHTTYDTLRIVLPAYAISDDLYDTGRPIVLHLETGDGDSEPSALPSMFACHKGHFARNMPRSHLKAVHVFKEYIATLIVRSTHERVFRVTLDGVRLCSAGKGKKILDLEIKTKA